MTVFTSVKLLVYITLAQSISTSDNTKETIRRVNAYKCAESKITEERFIFF